MNANALFANPENISRKSVTIIVPKSIGALHQVLIHLNLLQAELENWFTFMKASFF